MNSDFKDTLILFITASKILGLVNFCYNMKTGFLYLNMKLTYYLFLELIRMFVLLILTLFILFKLNQEVNISLLYFNIIKYWSIIIAARISEKWLIKFINGIIEFDSKLFLLNSSFPIRLYSLSKRFWIIVFIFFVLIFIYVQYYLILHRVMHIKDVSMCVKVLFHSPDIIIFVVLVTTLYYLSNLGFRFCELNRLWKCLPSGLIASPACKWTNSEITMLVERIRLLHSELSELLRLFSLGYGPVLLVYFTLTFAHALIETFLFTIYNDLLGKNILPYILYIQHIFHMISIVYVTSWVIDKIKIFMNQISVYEPNELTAFGFFNFDLKLTMSILVLLITGVSTMLQMKDHPWVLYLKNALTLSGHSMKANY